MRNLIISTSQGTLFVGESPKENNTGGKCLKLLMPELIMYGSSYMFRHYIAILRERS
jgi:hypothetical protein